MYTVMLPSVQFVSTFQVAVGHGVPGDPFKVLTALINGLVANRHCKRPNTTSTILLLEMGGPKLCGIPTIKIYHISTHHAPTVEIDFYIIIQGICVGIFKEQTVRLISQAYGPLRRAVLPW